MDTQANKPHRSDEQPVDGGTNDIYNIPNKSRWVFVPYNTILYTFIITIVNNTLKHIGMLKTCIYYNKDNIY